MSSAVVTGASSSPRREAIGKEFGDEGAGNHDALVDVEPEIAEPRFVREIRGRHALVDAPDEKLQQSGALGLRQRRVEKGLEPIERKSSSCRTRYAASS